jgi:hypothetical protein
MDEIIEEDTFEGNSLIDMDALIDIHEQFLHKIFRLCMLDSKSK